MLKIRIPKISLNEQYYILDIMLGDFLGLAFDIECYDDDVIEISRLFGSNTEKLTINASFFHKIDLAWLKSESMPILPLNTWKPKDDGINANLVEPRIPVLYGEPGLIKNDNHFHLNLDVLGSTFFMLSRYEELVCNVRDNHCRFPAFASIAFKAGFLDRPLVNEYLEILWECIRELWPDLIRKNRKFRKLISCDVDHPLDLAGTSLKRTILRVGSRLIRDRNPYLAFYDGLNYVFKKFNCDRFDEYRNNIDWMMKVNEDAGNKVAFYFIPIQTDKYKEDSNDIRSDKISKLLKHIVDSGHEVGFHPGYKTYNHRENFKQSADALKLALTTKSINFQDIGGRQHYLMYDIATTPQLWQENGFIYDSSLGYADRAGFRCGVCYEYKMYDLVKREKMNLFQRPLIVMEVTLLSYEELPFDNNQLYNRILSLKEVVKKYNGDFTLLWHNNSMPKNNTYLNSIK